MTSDDTLDFAHVGSDTLAGRFLRLFWQPVARSADLETGRPVRVPLQDVDPDYAALFVVEDNVAVAGQGRITNRSKDRLGQSDKGIILLRKIWERELSALADGLPLKKWSRPKHRLDLAVSNIRETADFV
jgi:hypothetical protein